MIAQITDDAPDRRAAGQNELSALEYLCPLKTPTVKHGQSRILAKITVIPYLLHNEKWDCSYRTNLWKP